MVSFRLDWKKGDAQALFDHWILGRGAEESRPRWSVIRDVLGTGLGARPIASTDVFCFAPPDMPDDDLAADIGDAGRELLHSAGFRQYEISAFARAGRECRHNRNYWEFGDYLGIGAGAHGKVTLAGGDI